MTRNVFVIGLGLIGGSIALSCKKAPHTRVIGYDASEKTRELASTLKIVDDVVEDVIEAAKIADIIIFGTPVNATLDWLDQLKQWPLKENVIVTDTGSTKGLIMAKGAELRECGITFIGGHPMAGSHKSGVMAAKPHLFENAYYMLTPLKGEDEANVTELEQLLKFTLAKIVKVDAQEHDHMTAVVSHFPHIVAASLVHQLDAEQKYYPMTTLLAAGGFRDITRIASSNPLMWKDIVLQNRQELIGQLDSWLEEMNRVKEIILSNEQKSIEDYFAIAKKVRDDLPITTGAFYTTFDLYVDIPDYPGVISQLTGYLADERISITNIRVVEAREDIFGILVISFQSAEDREKAEKCISRRTNFEMYVS
ncbi:MULTISPECIES: prephenate dehydrogenase [Lysinibacillus]|uniref:Prephenate dehydrogenase n=1 Tax=Lysinibacillus antri TaxID=2498145 RepID=A0A3S0P7G3_9BACI|nr:MULTISPECIES: prephenate dehydrogenase [Lysinibacillus]RUL55480.1 prephenate dehydrogenase [Lysinibacillus antri]TSI09044.1 prephenate dehydrogenase [Lysinibacillus sp. BW-2-10]